MENRQRRLVKERMKTARYRIVGALGILVLSWGLARLALSYPGLPDIYPREHGYSAIEGKERLLLEAGLAVFIYALLAAAERFPQLWNLPFQLREGREDQVYETIHRMLHTLKPAAALVLLPPIDLPAWAALGSIALPVGVLVYYMRKLYRVNGKG